MLPARSAAPAETNSSSRSRGDPPRSLAEVPQGFAATPPPGTGLPAARPGAGRVGEPGGTGGRGADLASPRRAGAGPGPGPGPGPALPQGGRPSAPRAAWRAAISAVSCSQAAMRARRCRCRASSRLRSLRRSSSTCGGNSGHGGRRRRRRPGRPPPRRHPPRAARGAPPPPPSRAGAGTARVAMGTAPSATPPDVRHRAVRCGPEAALGC